MPSPQTHLRYFVSSWTRQIQSISYADLPRRQDPPFASLTFGAAGIAFALLRVGEALEDRDLLMRGERWARVAERNLGPPPSLQVPAGVAAGASLAYGGDGIRLLKILLAQARGDAPLAQRRVGSFIRSVRATRRR